MKIEDILNAQMNAEGYGYENHDGDVIVIDQETAEEVLESIEENLGALEAQAEVVEELKEDLEEVREVIDSGTTEGQQAAEAFLDKMAMFYNTAGVSNCRPVRLSKESLGTHLSSADDMMGVLNQSAEGFRDAIKNAWEKFTAWLKRMVESIGKLISRVVAKVTGIVSKGDDTAVSINNKGVEFAIAGFEKVKTDGAKLVEVSNTLFDALKNLKDQRNPKVATQAAEDARRIQEDVTNYIKKGWGDVKNGTFDKTTAKNIKRQVDAANSKMQSTNEVIAKLMLATNKGNAVIKSIDASVEASASAGANKASGMFRKAVASVVALHNKSTQALEQSIKSGAATEK